MTNAPSCGLVGCGISERLQGVVEHAHKLLPGSTRAAPPPPPEPAAWWSSPWLLALAAALLLALAAVAVRRSPRLQGLVRVAVAAARVQAQPVQVVRWGGPAGRVVLAVAAGAWRFVRAGHGARSQALRAVAVLTAAALVIGSPLGVGSFALGAMSAATGVPGWLLVPAIVGIVAAVVVASRDEREDTAAWWSCHPARTARRLVGTYVCRTSGPWL